MTELQHLKVAYSILEHKNVMLGNEVSLFTELCDQKQDVIDQYQKFIARLKMESPMAYNGLIKE